MTTVRVGGCVAVMLLAVSLAQGQGRQGPGRQGLLRQDQAPEQQPEGRSLVDWYFFDVSNFDAPEGQLVSVPPAAHHGSFSHGAKTASIDRSDMRCFHRGTASEGVCATVADCAHAARQIQHWGRTEMCADGALVCCPGLVADVQEDFPSPSWDPYTFEYFPAPSCGRPHHHHDQQQHQNFHPAPPMPQVPQVPQVPQEPQVPQVPQAPQDSQYFDNPYQQAGEPPIPAPALPPVIHAPHVQPFAQPPMNPMVRPPMKPMAPPPMKPMAPSPMKPMVQPPMKPMPPTKAPEPLVPLIEDDDDATTPAGKQPGDVARKKCVEYERYAPTVRFGPDKDCIPNHTYPIGGNPALPREFPHFAQLGSGARGDIQWFCGGALIAPSWIVTAAHCLYSGSRKVQWVRLGDIEPESDEDDSNPQIIAVAQAVRHPDYKVPEVYNDIALLRLAREPDMSTPHVRPACLQVDYKLKKDKLNLIGFGLTEENGDPAKELMEVALWRTPGDKCKDFFEGPINLRQLPDGLRDESQLCAGLDQVGKDACQGDSGGPLNTPYSPTCMHAIPGITSFGQGCGRGAPGVYTRVSHFVPWIERIVWPEEFE